MSDLLTTVGRVQQEPGMSTVAPDLITNLIFEVSDDLERACSRKFARAVGVVDALRGYGSPELRVETVWPLVSVASVVFDTGDGNPTTIAATDYRVLVANPPAETAAVRKIRGLWEWTAERTPDITRDPLPGTERRWWVVTYTGGYITRQQDEAEALGDRTLPYDVERAVLDQVVATQRRSGRDQTVKSKKLMSGSTTYGSASGREGFPAHWTASFVGVVEGYRR